MCNNNNNHLLRSDGRVWKNVTYSSQPLFRRILTNCSQFNRSEMVALYTKASKLLFAVRLLSYGLDIYLAAPHYVVASSYMIWPLCFVALLLDRVTEHLNRVSSSTITCIDAALLLNEFNSMVMCLLIYRSFVSHKSFYRDVLHRYPLDTRLSSWNSALCLIYSAALLIYTGFIDGPVSTFKLVVGMVSFHVWTSSFMFLGLYTLVTGVIRQQLTDLLDQLLIPSGLDIQELVRSRWTVRDATSAFNEICGMVMFLLYLKSFTSTIFLAGSLIYSSIGTSIFALSVCHVCYLLQMHLAVAEASCIEDHCDRIDRVLYRNLRDHQPFDQDQLHELRAVLSFRSNWDSLKMLGGFAVDTRSFYLFLASCVTCIAVILQFDSKVMLSLNKAIDYLRSNEQIVE